MTEDKQKWIRNQLEFLKPLALFSGTAYFLPIIAKLGVEGHVVGLQDFIPSSVVVTSITVYIVNALYDLIRKWAK